MSLAPYYTSHTQTKLVQHQAPIDGIASEKCCSSGQDQRTGDCAETPAGNTGLKEANEGRTDRFYSLEQSRQPF